MSIWPNGRELLMSIASDALKEAIEKLASIQGLAMDSFELAQDVFLLLNSFPDHADFDGAVDSTVRAIGQLIDGRVDISSLKYDFAG